MLWTHTDYYYRQKSLLHLLEHQHGQARCKSPALGQKEASIGKNRPGWSGRQTVPTIQKRCTPWELLTRTSHHEQWHLSPVGSPHSVQQCSAFRREPAIRDSAEAGSRVRQLTALAVAAAKGGRGSGQVYAFSDVHAGAAKASPTLSGLVTWHALISSERLCFPDWSGGPKPSSLTFTASFSLHGVTRCASVKAGDHTGTC